VSEVALLRERLQHAKDLLGKVDDVLMPNVPSVQQVWADKVVAENRLREERGALALLKNTYKQVVRTEIELDRELVDLTRDTAAPVTGNCAACGQAMPAAVARRARGEREAALDRLTVIRDDLLPGARTEASKMGDAVESAGRDVTAAEIEVHRLKLLEVEARRAEEFSAKVEAKRAEAKKAVADAENNLWTAEDARAVHESDCELYGACAQVLGMRGLRAVVLGRALSGVEAAANAWLSKLAPGARLTLKSYTERQSGAVVDAIGVEIAGFGGGLGYRASSGGERRRLDVAVLLALADVAMAGRGGQPGTVFADELFDALDDDGVAAAASVLEELGRTRPVVVITHNDALAASVKADVRWRVENGCVSVS
jgi:DNA repair exonuclease SbcCD ATPase subunit